MGRMLLAIAAASIAAVTWEAPADAGGPNDDFRVTPGLSINVPGIGGPRNGFVRDGRRHHHGGGSNGGDHHGGHDGHDHDRDGDDDSLGIWVQGGEWARWNNQTFNSESFNDWWHSRPDRAYPAWVRNNQMMQNCRLYYSGGGWRC